MAKGISTVDRTSNKATCLKGKQINFAIRYYSETTQIPTKVITAHESRALKDKGIKIGVVYQDRQNQIADFSKSAGRRDGDYAFAYAESLGQPTGTGIFFAVDFDPSATEIRGPIKQYFLGVKAAFDDASDGKGSYRIGAYGSGLTCRLLSEDFQLVELTWLSESTGWRESKTYDKWNCKQFRQDGELCGLSSWEECITSGSTSWLFTPGSPADSAPSVPVSPTGIHLPVLEEGDKDPAVKILKKYLNSWLRLEGAQLLFLTKKFTNRTQRAVKAFQSKNVDNFGNPLTIDGAVGGLTWGALKREAEGIAAPSKPPKSLTPGVELVTTDSSWYKSMPASAFGGSARGRKALEKAISELNSGAQEIGGNNSGKFVMKYLDGRTEGEPASWCAAFVSWCFRESGSSMPYKYSLGARDTLNQLKEKGKTYDPSPNKQPEPGDLIIWWRGSPSGWMGHIGFVHHVSNGFLYTIEGNKTSKVQGFRYPLAGMEKLLGFARV